MSPSAAAVSIWISVFMVNFLFFFIFDSHCFVFQITHTDIYITVYLYILTDYALICKRAGCGNTTWH